MFFYILLFDTVAKLLVRASDIGVVELQLNHE